MKSMPGLCLSAYVLLYGYGYMVYVILYGYISLWFVSGGSVSYSDTLDLINHNHVLFTSYSS